MVSVFICKYNFVVLYTFAETIDSKLRKGTAMQVFTNYIAVSIWSDFFAHHDSKRNNLNMPASQKIEKIAIIIWVGLNLPKIKLDSIEESELHRITSDC